MANYGVALGQTATQAREEGSINEELGILSDRLRDVSNRLQKTYGNLVPLGPQPPQSDPSKAPVQGRPKLSAREWIAELRNIATQIENYSQDIDQQVGA